MFQSSSTYRRLPEHMQGAVDRYIERGIPPGSFLYAVLANDLRGAYGRADAINRERIGDYLTFFYCDAPAGCHGSPERVDEWIAHGGLHGLNATESAA